MAIHRIARVDVLPAGIPVRPDEDETRGRSQQHVFLRIETDQGAVGWGEARALPSWTGETLEATVAALSNYFTPALLGKNPFARNAIMAFCEELITGTMAAAKAAVDTALYDVQGKIAGLPVHEFFGGKRRDLIRLSHSLRSGTPDQIREAAQKHHDSRCLKVKLSGDPGHDAERVAAVVDGAPNAEIWLDANQNYTPTSALLLLDRVAGYKRIACLQQPVPSRDWLGMARLRERSPIPIAIDEGFNSPDDVLRLAPLGVADMVVLKLCKSGGLRELADTAALAKAAGFDVLGSGLTESSIGLAAALHVYSTIDLRLPPQLNGPQYLETLVAEGLVVENGTAIGVPNKPGLGLEVDEETIRSLAMDL
ncbi:MAG: muconate cycloisomerase [Nitrospirae bacterium]|nr:muconate cycloisomerase [Fimbriimonadaceae bacterium]